MAHKELVVALSMILATSPVSAIHPEPTPMTAAPTGSADTKYCMRIEPFTSTRIEFVKCWTRQEWAEQDVNVDKDWGEDGVAIINEGVSIKR